MRNSPETPVLCVFLEKAETLRQTLQAIQGSLLKQLIQFKEYVERLFQFAPHLYIVFSPDLA